MSDDQLIRQGDAGGELTIPQLASRMEKLRDVMRSVMKEGEDYGKIPGTTSKPTLLKAGAEKLGVLFRYSPTFEEEILQLPDGHREYRSKCRLTHIPTQTFAGEASAVCSTMESKYRYRGGARKCPKCGKETIKKSKFPPRDAPKGTEPGFYCFAKIGGCGANFTADDTEITSQSEVKTENPDIADSYNTVQQIAQKRAYVAAIKTATASSELFTQDLEDAIDPERGEESHAHPPHDDAHRPAPPKPAPQLSRDFEQLRDNLYKMGVPKGNVEHADAIIDSCIEGKTLKMCAADQATATAVLDKLIEQTALGGKSTDEIYRDALVRKNIAIPDVLAAEFLDETPIQ